MSSPQTQRRSDLQAVADAVRSNDRFLLVTHENPDGDALGSLLATKLALDAMSKDSEMYLYGDAPLPREYGFMALGGLRRELPDDAGERVLVALDCANESRMGPLPELLERSPLTLDIDHHHDNSRFGDINLVVGDASSTGEVLREGYILLIFPEGTRSPTGELQQPKDGLSMLALRTNATIIPIGISSVRMNDSMS